VAARREIDPGLLARARRRELTRANTALGTPERQAVDRITYLRRRTAHPELTARQALAHASRGDVLPRIGFMVDDPPRWIEPQVSRRDAQRAGRYMALVGRLANREIGPDTFRRRVHSWRPLPGGLRFLADPDAVLAFIEVRRAADVELFVYESGRAV
jgi:hypothetical protein